MKPLHFSKLKWMSKSAAHYRYALDHPMKQTKAMLLGGALDALVFKTKEVVTFDGGSRRTKAWTTFEEQSDPESVLLLPPERAQVDGMLAALQSNSAAMELLSGETQRTLKWRINDRECEGTPDVFDTGKVVELKSTINANPNKFQWDARNRGYHAQLAWYWNALNTLKLTANDAKCWIVAVESTPPHSVTIFKLTEGAMLEGAKMWCSWLERLRVCEHTDLWPGYTDAVVPFEVLDTDSLTLKIEGEDVDIDVAS